MSVKRRDLIRYLEKNGFYLHREGGKHSIYTNDKKVVPVKRHKQLDRITANELCKQAGLDPKFYPQVYGSVELEPRGEFVVRSFASFTLTYTAGRYGIDDSGAIRVSFRMVGDGGRLQINDPAAPNYVTARTSCADKPGLRRLPYGIGKDLIPGIKKGF